jgi:serine protease AprX
LLLINNWEYKLSKPLKKWADDNNQTSHGEILLEFYHLQWENMLALLEANKVQIQRKLHLIPAVAVDAPVSVLKELAKSGWVKRIWVNAPVQACLNQKISCMGGRKVQELGYTGKGVVIAVLDTGIFPHEDLTTPGNRILAWNDLIRHQDSPYDDNGHGTHVAGIIAGNGANSAGEYKGMAPEARLVGIKVLDQNGAGRISDVIAGIEWCLDHLSRLNIKVINLSFQTMVQDSYRTDPLARAVTAAWNQGIMISQAFINNQFEGNIENWRVRPRGIRVGNWNEQQILTDNDLDQKYPLTEKRADHSARPDIVAMGMGITSLGVDNDYALLSGTSMATALVTGGIALMLERWPSLKPEQIRLLLMKKARDLGVGSEIQGSGILDMANIFKGARRKVSAQSQNSLSVLNNPLISNIFKLFNNPNLQQGANDWAIKTIFSLLNNLKSGKDLN